MAKPLHIQRLEKALDLGPFMKYAEQTIRKNDEIENSSDDEGLKRDTYHDKELIFNAENISEDRKWLYNLFMSDTESDSDESDSERYIADMLKDHVREKRFRQKYHQNPTVSLPIRSCSCTDTFSFPERSVWILQRRSVIQSRHVSRNATICGRQTPQAEVR